MESNFVPSQWAGDMDSSWSKQCQLNETYSAPRDSTLLGDAGDRAEVINHLTMRRPALESSFGRSFNHSNPRTAQSMQGTACFRFYQIFIAPVSRFKVC